MRVATARNLPSGRVLPRLGEHSGATRDYVGLHEDGSERLVDGRQGDAHGAGMRWVYNYALCPAPKLALCVKSRRTSPRPPGSLTRHDPRVVSEAPVRRAAHPATSCSVAGAATRKFRQHFRDPTWRTAVITRGRRLRQQGQGLLPRRALLGLPSSAFAATPVLRRSQACLSRDGDPR